MKSEHITLTDGPWFVDQYGHVYGWKRVDGIKKESVVLVDGRASKATTADRTLMSASKELLSALEELIDVCDCAMREANNDGAEYNRDEELKAAKAAIAKAKGQG